MVWDSPLPDDGRKYSDFDRIHHSWSASHAFGCFGNVFHPMDRALCDRELPNVDCVPGSVVTQGSKMVTFGLHTFSCFGLCVFDM